MAAELSPNDWTRLESLVDRILDAPLELRTALLTELSEGSAELRAELERLVAECEEPYPLLDRPAAERFATLFEQETIAMPNVLAERYQIMRQVGRGGMAIVYLARDVKHERDVAVKVVRPELVATLGRARFLREIAIAARLKHPHIVPLFDSGEVNGLLYYVMPYQEEQSLRERLRRDGRLSIGDTLGILHDVCDALAYAHQQGIVHRDIKPDNVLLSGRHAMVTDFGVARALKAASDGDDITTDGRAVGTAAYMAPEQHGAGQAVDQRSDIFAVGVMAYEMLAGERPTEATAPSPHLTKIRDDIPGKLRDVVLKCLAADPVARYQSSEELLVDLDGLTRRTAVGRHPWMTKAVVVTAVLGAGLIWFAWPRAAPPVVQASPKLAVLVFQHRGSELLEPLAVGVSDNLIRVLAEAGLVVRSLDAVLPYRDGLTSINDLSRRLDVNWFVGGQLYRRADSTVATASLTDATGRRVDGAQVSAAFGDDVRLIEALVPRVATMLRRRVGDHVRVERWRTGTRSEEAFTAVNWAQKERRDAKALMARDDIPGARLHLLRADSALEAAARADGRWPEPLIQRATVALALARATFGSGLSRDSARHALAVGKEHGHLALRLDRNSARAKESLGMLLHDESGLAERAESSIALRDSAEALLLQASNADTTLVEAATLLSRIYFTRGEFDQAYVMAERAYAADAYFRDQQEVLSGLFVYSFEDEQDKDARRWCAAYGAAFPDDWFWGFCRLTLMIWDTTQTPNADTASQVARATIMTAPEVIRPGVRVQIQTLLAGVFARSNSMGSARRMLSDIDAAIQADPKIVRGPFSTELLEIEAAVRLRMGQPDSAIGLLTELFNREPQRRTQLQKSRRFRTLPFERLRDATEHPR